MSTSDADDDIPEVEVCDHLCKEFASITGTDSACAQFYLQDRKWDLEMSVNDFFEDRARGSSVTHNGEKNETDVVLVLDGSQDGLAAAASIVLRESNLYKDNQATTSRAKVNESSSQVKAIQNTVVNPRKSGFPEIFKFISWNIDGLDDKNLKVRTNAVTDYVKEVSADVVFLQEVIPKTAEYLKNNLPQYKFIFGGEREYFTGLAYNPMNVEYLSHSIEEFPDSDMGRNLLIAKVNIGGCNILLMNSHLESTVEHSQERKKQLKKAFNIIGECSSDLNVIFAGDLNLRDKELTEVGGIPKDIQDVWIACGQRDELKYTWDMVRNDNTIINGKFKPRARFDRVYFKPAKNGPTIGTNYFGLIGLKRIHPYRAFPSDHWGLLCFFSLNSQ